MGEMEGTLCGMLQMWRLVVTMRCGAVRLGSWRVSVGAVVRLVMRLFLRRSGVAGGGRTAARKLMLWYMLCVGLEPG